MYPEKTERNEEMDQKQEDRGGEGGKEGRERGIIMELKQNNKRQQGKKVEKKNPTEDG